MGRRDDELNEPDQAHEQAFRALLARNAEPRAAAPPPSLTRQVLARLPAAAPQVAAARRRRSLFAVAVLGLLALVVALPGAWAVLGQSSAVQATGDAGQLLLAVSLLVKPFVNLALVVGEPWLAPLLLLLVIATWFWWRLARSQPALAAAA